MRRPAFFLRRAVFPCLRVFFHIFLTRKGKTLLAFSPCFRYDEYESLLTMIRSCCDYAIRISYYSDL